METGRSGSREKAVVHRQCPPTVASAGTSLGLAPRSCRTARIKPSISLDDFHAKITGLPILSRSRKALTSIRFFGGTAYNDRSSVIAHRSPQALAGGDHP